MTPAVASAPQRVAFLVNQYPSVSHTFIRREIHALERIGLQVDRIALRGWDATLADAADVTERTRTRYVLAAGLTSLFAAMVATCAASPRRWFHSLRLALAFAARSERGWPVHLAYLAEACVIKRWLKDAGVTHLHAHFATNPAEIAALVNALGGPPFSFTAHGSDITDRPSQVRLDLTVSRAAFVAAVCSFGRAQLYKWAPYEAWHKVHVVRCGLEAGYGQDATDVDPQSRTFVCVGRLSKEKGQPLLIGAAHAAKSAGARFDVVLAGDGPMRAAVDGLIVANGMTTDVRVTGWLDAGGIRNELSHARALVVPSLSEGLPVVIMEAMAMRRPVIAPYLAGIPELVEHGQTGWLYPAGDADAMAQAMQACLSTSVEDLVRMGRCAAERVSRLHAVDTEAAELTRLMAQASADARHDAG